MLQLDFKNKSLKLGHWDQLSGNELIELFRRINAPWFSAEGRIELSKWLYSNQYSENFLVKKIQTGKHRFHGPIDGFRNIITGEFLFAETYYFTYLKTGEEEFLNKLVATLFRERKFFSKKKKNDIRLQFDETLINARAKLLESVKFKTRQAIMFNYGAVRKDMTKRFRFLFPQRNDDPKLVDREAQPAKKNIEIPNWDEWMWKLSAGNSDEDFDKIADMRALNFLKRIDSLIEEAKRKGK